MKNTGQRKKCFDQCGFSFERGMTAVCLVLLSVLTAFADDSPNRPIAITESGFVIGSTAGGIHKFLGIPYAAPPVGDLIRECVHAT